VNLLAAVTENAETFVTSVADSFKSDVTIRFLQALQQEFGKKLHLVMDNATYFTSKKVSNFIENSKLKVTYLPTGSPDMNPVEKVWRQFKQALGNRYFGSLEELRPAVWSALQSVNVPNIRDCLCP
jgi:Transposase and inactivated derivatives